MTGGKALILVASIAWAGCVDSEFHETSGTPPHLVGYTIRFLEYSMNVTSDNGSIAGDVFLDGKKVGPRIWMTKGNGALNTEIDCDKSSVHFEMMIFGFDGEGDQKLIGVIPNRVIRCAEQAYRIVLGSAGNGTLQTM